MTGEKLDFSGVRLEPWSLVYDTYDAEKERTREALCTLGNGKFATRGAASEVLEKGVHHYPGTYAAGLYNRLTSEVQGKVVEHEELVNLPNWLPVRFVVDGATPFAIEEAELLAFRQELDLARGVLLRDVRVRDPLGRCVRIEEQRFVHMQHPHLAGLQIRLEIENWSGTLAVESWIDGRVQNTNADEYEGLDRRHLECVDRRGDGRELSALRVRTRRSRVEIATATRTRVRVRSDEGPEAPACAATKTLYEDARVGLTHGIEVQNGTVVTIEKLAALYTSRDVACSEPLEEAESTLLRAESFAVLLTSHEQAWERLWSCFSLDIPGHENTVTALRLHAFHILQTVSAHTPDLDVGIPARGLHGENYHGHVFWDELFVFPVLNLRWPELTRALLLYRYRRLPEACAQARTAGHRGAMFPWRSASDGRDVTERWRRNPRSGRWIADNSYLERHINAAVVYSVWAYYQMTGDKGFLVQYGAEIGLSVASFWSSAAEYDEADGRYHLRGVVGPDEFHDAYPDSTRPGIDDNAYTNVMAVWCLLRARDMLELLSAEARAPLLTQLQIDERELARWDTLTRRMAVPFHDDGIISQFRGFERLSPFPWEEYRRRYENVRRLDNILEAEGDTVNRYQVCKQADVLMLFHLLSEEEIRGLFERLGYGFDEHAYARNVKYYRERTSNGSTLSRVAHAWVLTRLDRQHSWRTLRAALGSDLAEVHGASTREGVHLGAMAGTIDVFQRAYLGLEARADVLWLDPQLPPEIGEIALRIRYRSAWLDIRFDHAALRVESPHDAAGSVRLCVAGASHTLEPGGQKSFALRPRSPRERAATTSLGAETVDAENAADGRPTTTPRTR